METKETERQGRREEKRKGRRIKWGKEAEENISHLELKYSESLSGKQTMPLSILYHVQLLLLFISTNVCLYMYLETSKLLKGKTFALFYFLNFHQNKMTIKTIMLVVQCMQNSSLSKKRNREILFTRLWYREHHPAENISQRVVQTTMIRAGFTSH